MLFKDISLTSSHFIVLYRLIAFCQSVLLKMIMMMTNGKPKLHRLCVSHLYNRLLLVLTAGCKV